MPRTPRTAVHRAAAPRTALHRAAAPLAAVPVALALTLGLTGCGSAAEAEKGSETKAAPTASPEVQRLTEQAVTDYRDYLEREVAALATSTDDFVAAVQAGDLAKAKALYAPSRWHWETIEPIAGLVPEVDLAVDARVDDFASEEDPTWTGWHRIEHILWVKSTTAGAEEHATALAEEIHRLHEGLPSLDLGAGDVALGPAELIEEVSEGKITGEEDRYSHTDVSDFAANLAGAEAAFTALEPAVTEADPDLAATIAADFADVDTLVSDLETRGGYVLYTDLSDEQVAALKASFAALAETLSRVPGALAVS